MPDQRPRTAHFATQFRVLAGEGVPPGQVVLLAETPHGVHSFALDDDGAKQLGQALTAPRVTVPHV